MNCRDKTEMMMLSRVSPLLSLYPYTTETRHKKASFCLHFHHFGEMEGWKIKIQGNHQKKTDRKPVHFEGNEV